MAKESAPPESKRQRDVVVAGGGVLGAAVARECARRGFEVALLDPDGHDIPDPIGGSASDYRHCAETIQAGIDAARVRARTITLNHDAGRWLSLGLPGDLPAVVREVNGQWQRQ